MLWTLALSGGAIIANWLIDSVMVSFGFGVYYAEWFTMVREIAPIPCAIGILVVLTVYEGRTVMGLARRSAAVQFRASAEWTSTVFIALAALYLVSKVGILLWPSLQEGISMRGGGGEPSPLWFNLVASLHAGIIEEIIVIALGYRLLELLPWTIRGKQFALTGWATAILVAIRTGYHTYQGMYALAVIGFGWLSVRLYRHTRLILPLILAHVAYDVFASAIPIPAVLGFAGVFAENLAAMALGMAILLLLMALTRGPEDEVLIGFRSRKPKHRSEYFWANWRWQPAATGRPPAPVEPTPLSLTIPAQSRGAS